MTAEIAIMNRSAIALAADSAVTIGRDRVWKNTNKLFHLAPDLDIGVMFFGNADYGAIPWEVVIKEFRKSIAGSSFDTVDAAVEAFVAFATSFPEDNSTAGQVTSYVLLMDVIGMIIEQVDGDSAKARKAAMDEALTQAEDAFAEVVSDAGDIRLSEFRDEFAEIIDTLIDEEISERFRPRRTFRPNRRQRNRLVALCHRAWIGGWESTLSSGIVFAGYGSEQLLAQLVELRFDGRFKGRPRWWTVQTYDLGSEEASRAIVIPFAQSDIAHMFVEGILARYITYINKTFEAILNHRMSELISEYVPSTQRSVEIARGEVGNRAIVNEFHHRFRQLRREEFVSQMISAIASLPKEEMASMAEALVDITALRRKVEDGLETVGGPIDVAVISKADGFIWIKRKHYFDIAINQDYPRRRARRYGGSHEPGDEGVSEP